MNTRMPTPLLLTKLYLPPPRPGMVLRPRLVERLKAGLAAGRKLTLISAPAGFGKTTLVSEWIAALTPEVKVGWLSLDEGDHDLARFVTYLVAALQQIAPEVGRGTLAAMQSQPPPPIEPLLIPLVNDIADFALPLILVLDDMHLVEARPVDEALAFLVDHLPPNLHLVIASREDPPLPLARLRARGLLTELRAADLRFTPGEAAEFLNRMMGLNLSDGDIASLESRTEGWIAGLQLAALSMQGHQDTDQFIQAFTGSHHFVLDYLVEEVLQQQSDPIQAFLLRTAILERLCGSLCDAVLLDPSVPGQQTLEALEHANLFIIPLDHERRWFRFHHLFLDILRQRMGQMLSPAETAETHLRASLWHENNGDLAEAFHHAAAAGDYNRAAALAEAAWEGMDYTFQSAAWLGWAKRLPEDTTRVRPLLSIQMAQAFMDAGQPEASEACMQNVERCLDGPPDRRVVVDETRLKPLPAIIAMTRSYNALVQGNLSAAVKYAELSLQLIPEGDFFRRAQATIMLEVTHWTKGDLEAARSALCDWMERMEKAGNHAFVVASGSALADILVALGRLREAVRTYQQSLQLAAQHSDDTRHIIAHHYLGLAMLMYEMGEDRAAAEHLQKAREMSKLSTLVNWSYRWHLAQARLKESGGELETALALLDDAGRAYVKTPIPDARPIAALKAQVVLKQGRLDLAQQWARARGLTAEDEVSYLREFEHLTLVRVWMAEYKKQQSHTLVLEAARLLERLLAAAEGQRRTGSVIEILVIQALAHQEQGNLPQALAPLERALALAEPEGYSRLFVDEGEPMRLLLWALRERSQKQAGGQGRLLIEYIERLLSAFEHTQEIPAAAHPQTVNLIEPLSERELEVLRLLRSELSGPEIADQLVVSPNTFRTHTQHIYAKLGVNNRRAAVRRAEELDLF